MKKKKKKNDGNQSVFVCSNNCFFLILAPIFLCGSFSPFVFPISSQRSSVGCFYTEGRGALMSGALFQTYFAK